MAELYTGKVYTFNDSAHPCGMAPKLTLTRVLRPLVGHPSECAQGRCASHGPPQTAGSQYRALSRNGRFQNAPQSPPAARLGRPRLDDGPVLSQECCARSGGV